MNVVVVGGGKMGLPLGCVFAENGAQVTICDINEQLVAKINEGVSPHLEPDLNDRLNRVVKAGQLSGSVDTTNSARDADVVVIIVAALLSEDRDIDYGSLDAASRAVAAGMKPGVIVSYETTLPIGGCRDHLRPILEESGLKAGADFHLVFSPERVKSRLVFDRLTKTPKVVGGFDEGSGQAGEAFYKQYLGAEVINVGTMEAAEFTKLLGMIYRDVNIALLNEMASVAESAGVDIWPVRDAANTDNETHLLLPGIGVGGHCTPVYPYFLINSARRGGVSAALASLGRQINEDQPNRNVMRLKAKLGSSLQGKNVHVLGVAFRPSVREDAYSPVFDIQEALSREGAVVTVEDSLYTTAELADMGLAAAQVGEAALDAVILNTAHPEFRDPNFEAWHATGVKVVLDGRNTWDRDVVERAGVEYIGIGS